jgi:2-phosphosulfolactate phosphatase
MGAIPPPSVTNKALANSRIDHRMSTNRTLYTCLSPALIDLYEVKDTLVVIIDVLRATSTIAAALYNGAAAIIPVDSISECVRIAAETGGITAGERDGKVAEGLTYGNSPFEYPRTFIENKILVLTTTNGTRLLHMALERGAADIVTGSFPNLEAVCNYLVASDKNVILGCAAWKDKVSRVKQHFSINCDASHMAETLYHVAEGDCFTYMQSQQASHYHRLMGFGLEGDIRYCLTPNGANILPRYKNGKLVVE